jgi:hypothetical protein
MRASLLVFFTGLLLASPTQANDSLNVRFIGSCDTPGDARGLAVSGSYAYVADWNAGLRVISVADPTHPAEVGHFEGPDSAVGVAVSGNYAYVIDMSAGLRVISVADPANPAEVGYWDTPGLAYRVAVDGNYAYVADLDSGLWIISVADPAHPAMTGHLDLQWAVGLSASGHFIYVADYQSGLHVISVANPANPVEVGHNESLGFLCLAAKGNYAYVGQDRLYVVSLADSSHPSAVGSCELHDPANAVAVDNVYAYSVGYSKLDAVLVSDPANPVTVGYYHRAFWDARSVSAAGSYIYVIGDSGLAVCQRYDAGVEEITNADPRTKVCGTAIVRGALVRRSQGNSRNSTFDADLVDALGRKLCDLHPGPNDISRLSPGVYFVRERSAVDCGLLPAGIRKVVVTR